MPNKSRPLPKEQGRLPGRSDTNVTCQRYWMNPHAESSLLRNIFSLTLVACVTVLFVGPAPVAGLDSTAVAVVGPDEVSSAVDSLKNSSAVESRTPADRSALWPFSTREPSSSGRGQLNTAIDWILGIRSPVDASSLRERRGLGSSSVTDDPEQTMPRAVAQAPPAAKPAAESGAPKGKKRPPGEVSPTAPKAKEEVPVKPFAVERDPFRPPTEILPTECPPSLPLCRYDRAQLKLVGVIQVEQGHFKGMVEDPDGRGYFITPGMQIGSGTASATVTQINDKCITLHVHRSRQDVIMPLFKEPREGE